jgi:hypothetical protein
MEEKKKKKKIILILFCSFVRFICERKFSSHALNVVKLRSLGLMSFVFLGVSV